jgi:hypothetical protein
MTAQDGRRPRPYGLPRRAERRGLVSDALYSELCESERSRRLA